MRKFIVVFVSAILAACSSSPKEAVIPQDQAEWESALSDVFARLSDDDKAMLANYLERAKQGEGFGRLSIPRDMTVGRAINAERDYLARQAADAEQEKMLRARLDEQRAELQKQADGTLAVSLDQVRIIPPKRDRTTPLQQISVTLHNTGDKDIRAVTGQLIFLDATGTEVARIGFKCDDRIPAGHILRWRGGRIYDEQQPDHKALVDIDPTKYTIHFVASLITFADGSGLALN